MKSLCVLTFLLSFTAAYALAAEKKPLSVQECIDIALKNHPSIKSSEKTVTVFDEQYKEAFSSYYPKVSLDASYTRAEAKAVTFIPGVTESYQAFLKLEQKIYDFGRSEGTVEGARLRVDARTEDLSKARQDVIYNVKEAYFGVSKAIGLIKVQEAALVQAESHLRQAKAFYEAGAKAKFDVTKSEVDLNAAKLEVIKAGNAYSTAMASLKNRMGVAYSYPMDIVAVTGKSQNSASLEEGINEALKNRPEIKSVDAGIREGEASLKVSKGGYYPNLTASASFGYYDQYPVGSDESLFQDKNQRWNAGLALNLPLFEGFLTRSKVSESIANIEALKAQKDNVINSVTLEVTQAYLDLQNAVARIDLTESGVVMAKENLDIANGRYEAGVGTLLEVTDAQSALVKAETDLINARYDAEVARAKYGRAVGVY